MDIKQKPQELKNNLVKFLEPLVKRPLTDKEVSEAVFNLRGFGQTLIKMKLEIDKNERVSR